MDFIFPVRKFENNPLRSFIIKKNLLRFAWPKYQSSRSQDLDNFYYDTGSFYIYKTKKLLKIKRNNILLKNQHILN